VGRQYAFIKFGASRHLPHLALLVICSHDINIVVVILDVNVEVSMFYLYHNMTYVHTYIQSPTHTHTDRVIQKRRRDYSDPSSTSNMKKLNDDLHSIQNIMRKSIDDILDRGNKLDGECVSE
jgi:hypothetical protein